MTVDTSHSKRRTRNGTAVPCSPATFGLGKIPLAISITVSGPSRSSNTKFFTRIESTICVGQCLTKMDTTPIWRGWPYLEFGYRESLSKACPWAIDEGQQMPVSLDLFRPGRNTVIHDPAFRLELLGIGTPERRRAIHAWY
jgi:hypothetical protein